MMDYSYKDRVKRECRELGINKTRLEVFNRSPMFSALPEEEQERLIEQHYYMDLYYKVLVRRIEWFEETENEH